MTATHGASIEFARIEADALEWLGRYRVQAVCFDGSHGGLGLVQRLNEATGVTQIATPQRIMTISPAMREFQAAVGDGRFHYDGDPIATWCFSNIVTSLTVNELFRMPEKERPENKIDTAMATFFALSQAVLEPVKEETTWAFEPFLM